MIQQDFGFGKLLVTDRDFGHVGVGDATFLEQFQKELSSSPKKVAWMDQVHSPHVAVVKASRDAVQIFPDTDGLITKTPGILLISKTADCVPIFLWNKDEQAIAVLHCGWRGFFVGIIESFAEACRQERLSPSSFSAFLGPHLRAESFEVQQDFVDQIPKPKQIFLQEIEGKTCYDISRGVAETLRSIGVTSLQDCDINTFADPRFFSYRRWSQLPENERPAKYSTFANVLFMNIP